MICSWLVCLQQELTMLSFCKQLPNSCSLLTRGDHVVFTEGILETVSVLAVKHGYPAGLLLEVLEDAVVFSSQNPDELLCMSPTKSQLGQHVLLFGQSLASTTVVNDVRGWLALEDLIQSTKAVMQPFARVDDIHLGIRPDPWMVLISLVMQDCGAQDDDVAEDSPVGALEKVQGKDGLPAACLSTDDRRMGAGRLRA